MRTLYFFLLVAGPFCAWGQRPGWFPRADGFAAGDTTLRRLFPGFRAGDSALQRRLVVNGGTRLRVMGPDGMICVVPDPGRLERMPVDRRGNADRMPVDRRRGTDPVQRQPLRKTTRLQ